MPVDLLYETIVAGNRPRTKIVENPNPSPAIKGQCVMVTGAGGSIGSELVLQLAAHQPERLILVDQSELGLYEINRLLTESQSPCRTFPAICDIRHSFYMQRLLEKTRPGIVFHAAALKHVPLLENEHNLVEAVRTNVLGSYSLAEACTEHGARMVMISTDKAVNPSSVMGLTKRLAELVLIERAYRQQENSKQKLKLAIVRFGNVLGSSGSVVPLFLKQIQQGGPVTVTHEKMARYFMTIKQSVDLVIQTTEQRATDPYLYVLDMGKPVAILEMASRLIEMCGFRIDDIGIVFTGLRPGEKLEEELHYAWEVMAEFKQGIHACRIPKYKAAEGELIERIQNLVEHDSVYQLKKEMAKAVPEFTGAEHWK